jgi:hypothetical protein
MESLRSSGDFRELLSLFNAEGVRYLIVGAFALAHYGKPRYTKDLDIWIARDEENAPKVYQALARFGAPLDRVSSVDFLDADTVFQIGVEPLRIDILTDISGVSFSDAWPLRESSAYGDTPVNVIGRADYVRNKIASGRPADLRDVATLEELS